MQLEVVLRFGAMHIIYITGAHERIRFGELEAHLDVSHSTIATRLNELQDAGLLNRTSFDEVPPHVEYSLTQRGEELFEKLTPLIEWAAEVDRTE